MNELDAAMIREMREKSIIVIPILIGNVDINKIPGDLSGKHYIDLRFNFSKRYRLAKTAIVLSISARDDDDESKIEIIRMGDDAVRRIISYGYANHFMNDMPLEHLLEIYLSAILEKQSENDEEWLKELQLKLTDFIKRYGELTAKELIAFVIEHNDSLRNRMTVLPKGRVFLALLTNLSAFLTAHALSVKLKQQGVIVEMLLGPRSLRFRIKGFGPTDGHPIDHVAYHLAFERTDLTEDDEALINEILGTSRT